MMLLPVLFFSVTVEIFTQVKDRVMKNIRIIKDERDHQTADAAVPVSERMDNFELIMGNGDFYQNVTVRIDIRNPIFDQMRNGSR